MNANVAFFGAVSALLGVLVKALMDRFQDSRKFSNERKQAVYTRFLFAASGKMAVNEGNETYNFNRMFLEFRAVVAMNGGIGVVKAMEAFVSHGNFGSPEAHARLSEVVRQMRLDIGESNDPNLSAMIQTIINEHRAKEVGHA